MRATAFNKELENAGLPHLLTDRHATATVRPHHDGTVHLDQGCARRRTGVFPRAQDLPLAEVMEARRNNLTCGTCFTEMPHWGSEAYRATVVLAELLRAMRLAEGDLGAAATPTPRRLLERERTVRSHRGDLQAALRSYRQPTRGSVFTVVAQFIERAEEISVRLQEAQKDPHAREAALQEIANAVSPWELTNDAPTVLALRDGVYRQDNHRFTPFEIGRTTDNQHAVLLAPAYAAHHLAYVAAPSQYVAPIVFQVNGDEATLREALHNAPNLEELYNLVGAHQ